MFLTLTFSDSPRHWSPRNLGLKFQGNHCQSLSKRLLYLKFYTVTYSRFILNNFHFLSCWYLVFNRNLEKKKVVK